MFTMKTSGGPEEQDKSLLFHSLTFKKYKMKKTKAIGLIITLIMISFSCEELPDPAGLRGVAVVPGISDLNPGIFDSKDLQNSYIEFAVDIPAGSSVEKITILGSFNDNDEDAAITEVTSFPAIVRIVSSDAAQKIGIALDDIVNNDFFTFELLTTAGGRATLSNAVLIIPVACAFDGAMAIGSYHAIESGWPFEGDVTMTADPDDPYTIYVSGLANLDDCGEDLGPFVMHINPATFEVTTEAKLLASDYYGYGGITYAGSGVYNSCDGSYTLNIDISVGDYGSQGIFVFNLTRN